MPTLTASPWPTSWRDLVAGVLGAVVVVAIVWSAIVDQSAASGTALVGALGAVTGWAFRGAGSGSGSASGNGNGNGTAPNGTAPNGGAS